MDFPTPYGGRNRMQLTKSEYAKGIFGALILISIVAGYTFEIRHFSNTFDVFSLVVRSLILGLVLGLLIGFYFSKHYKDALVKFQIIVAFVFAGLIVTPLLVSWVNRWGASKYQMEDVVYESQQIYSQSRFGKTERTMDVDGYYLFVVRNRQMKRLTIKEEIFGKKLDKGTIIQLPFRKGLLGYDHFKEADLK